MEQDTNTAKAGAEPANTGVTATAGAEPAKDAKTDSSTEEKPAPFDKDPRWKSARTAEKKLNDLLKANGIEDPDDLVDLIEVFAWPFDSTRGAPTLTRTRSRNAKLSQEPDFKSTTRARPASATPRL